MLKDCEDVAVKARAVYADHVGETLTKVAGEDEHVSHTFQLSQMLRSAVDGREVKVVDVAYLIGSEGNLLMTVRRYLHKVKGGSDPCAIPCSPVKSGTELRADLLDGGQGKNQHSG